MPDPLDTITRLVNLAGTDTVYRDLYLTRARALLAPTLSPEQYGEAQAATRAIAAAVAESRAAALRLDWPKAEAQAKRADDLRRAAAARSAAMAIGEQVYDAAPTVVDPFSPGLADLAEGEPSALRAQALADLAALATADAPQAAFYAARRAFLEHLVVVERVASTAAASGEMSVEEMQQRALAAAERGDVAALARFAGELAARQQTAAAAPAAPRAAAAAAPAAAPPAGCPVDLAAPLPPTAVERAARLGLAAALAAPLTESQSLLDFIATHIGQARPADAEAQREGAQRIAALRAGIDWPAEATAAISALLGQFLQHVFVNSGGARYVPPLGAEAALVEDFAEDGEPPTGPLLAALGLAARRGLSRVEIERALHARGAALLRDELGLDPLDYRLVCVPPDLYTRVGRERGWGQREQWTHFDGYQVLKNGVLRALVGGDARYGGLNDLVSIAANDQRAGVVARFAVIRRARQVARWR